MKLSEISFVKDTGYEIKKVLVDNLKFQNIKMIVSNCLDGDSFFVFADDYQVECFVKKLSDEKENELIFKIPQRTKKITILCKKNNEYVLIYQITINIFQKIKVFLRKIKEKMLHSFYVVQRGVCFLWREHHFLIPFRLWKEYFQRFTNRFNDQGEIFLNPYVQSDYLKWISSVEEFEQYRKLEYEPLMSILIPVYNVSGKLLAKCLDSVLNQTYQNFEVCIVDDCSTKVDTLQTLAEYEKKDRRILIKHRLNNGHISKATNDALNMAKGEFICLLDNDDELAPQALFENVLVLNKDKTLDFIYSDEDKLDLKGERIDPHFKPDFSPDTLLGINYITHFAVLRTSLVRQVGGFEIGLEGVQDHDLFLKISEVTNRIYHISKILYHWRMTEGSTAITTDNKGYAVERGIKAINNALDRRHINGDVKSANGSTVYLVEYTFDEEPSVSIIIPMRDYADVTEKCIKSIYEKTNYSNFEIIIVDNNSQEEKTFQMFKKYIKQYSNFKVIKADMEFNYSAINNLAINNTKSDVIVLLNNDTEVLSENWLTVMVGYAIQKHIGAVGVKLLYPDMTIQHGGVLIGLGGEVAEHAFITRSRDEIGLFGRLMIPYNYSAVTAACLAIERKKFDEVNGLEEKLKVAYNDVDFCLKLIDIGYYNVFLPQVELLHYESKSRGMDTTNEKYRKFIQESNYMQQKWNNYILRDPYYNDNYSKKGAFLFDQIKKVNNNEI